MDYWHTEWKPGWNDLTFPAHVMPTISRATAPAAAQGGTHQPRHRRRPARRTGQPATATETRPAPAQSTVQQVLAHAQRQAAQGGGNP